MPSQLPTTFDEGIRVKYHASKPSTFCCIITIPTIARKTRTQSWKTPKRTELTKSSIRFNTGADFREVALGAIVCSAADIYYRKNRITQRLVIVTLLSVSFSIKYLC